MADFTNIDGVYAKDAELRQNIDTLRSGIINETIKPLTITKNGTYTAIPSSGTYGYSPITVDVVEEPWQPLNDGYSNFWFELTNDTLSPWLNFSKKTSNAVIDWGDGSGEQALTTLTPTHTYSKAGKYVVKVKGVTGIARLHDAPYKGFYLDRLKYIELNNEVSALSAYSFVQCIGLKKCVLPTTISASYGVFQYCVAIKEVLNISLIMNNTNGAVMAYCHSLETLNIDEGVISIGPSSFTNCISLKKVTLPSTLTTLNNTVFNSNSSLSEIHIKATTPPTLGTNVFNGVASDYIIYVPVGYGETYKAASGWSTYADHILEEGQTPNRMMLAKFGSAGPGAEEPDNEEMR